MSDNQSLDRFIARLAQKIAETYPNNCADADDYIQAGYLKLLELNSDGAEKRNFRAYAIVSIARAMRDTAIDAMCSISAPKNAKRQLRRITELLTHGKTETEICKKLKIPRETIVRLRSLILAESWHTIFGEPTECTEPFSVINDILSSGELTDEDKNVILAQFNGDLGKVGPDRKSRWRRYQNIRPKLTRSGYGV
jgi:DNA-directed RNA polymerase specialized sigma subunit